MKIRLKQCSYIIYTILISVMVFAGCSEGTHPDILEPVISLSEASDISRTEAKLIGSVDRRGASELSYITLFYGLAESDDLKMINGNPAEDNVQFYLTDLMPGHSYVCHIEGGTETATLKSNTIAFTTIPNDIPKLSSVTPLSTGPLGIIVEFSIIDDGGEAISEAGCEVRAAGSAESRRVYISNEKPAAGVWQLNITGLTPATTYTIIPFASNSTGEAHGEILEYTTQSSIVLQQPGVLASLLVSKLDLELEKLTISGFMNGDDFRTLRYILGAPVEDDGILSGIKARDIDLSDVKITEGGEAYDGSHFTVTDELTTGIFTDCTLLQNAILPNTVTRLARNAFAGCTALESFIISAGIEELLPSSGCISLKAIEVSKANRHFTSIDGVLFNYEATEILWFPTGKNGDYQLPPTITAIGENAFVGTHITRLTIPASVTTISRGAFVGSALIEISLPDNITNVYEGMFQNCSNLNTVHLGSGTEYIGDFAFDGTDIKQLYIAADIPPYAMENAFTNGDTNLFGDCILYIPKGCKKIYANHSKWGNFSNIEEFQP